MSKINKFGAFMLLLALVAFVGCGEQINHLEVGEALLEQGKVEEASVEFKKVVEKNPDLARAHFGLGNVAMKKNMLEEAADHYRKAFQLDSTFVEAYQKFSDAYIEIGNPDDAFQTKYNPVMQNPDDPMAHIDLAVFYHKWDQTRKAIEEYEEALKLDPDNPFTYYNLAVAYQDMGLFEDKSIPLYLKSIEINPKYDDAHYNLAVSYLKSNNLEKAMGEYKKTLAINPEYATVYVDYGMIKLQEKKV